MGFIGSFPIRISNIWSPPWERILHNIVPKASLNWNKTSQKDLWGDFTLFGKSVLPLDLNLKRSSLWRKMHFHRNFSGVGKLKCCWPEYKSKLFWHKGQKSLKFFFGTKAESLWKFYDYVELSAKQDYWSNSCILEAKSGRNCKKY